MSAAEPSTINAWVNLPTGERISAVTASLSMDRAWSPYVQASVTVPYTAERLAACDARNGRPRIVVSMRRQWYGAPTLDELGEAWGGMSLAQLGVDLAGTTLDGLGAALTSAWSETDPWRVPDELHADLAVRSVTVDHAAATMTITAASDELLAQRRHVAMDRPAESTDKRITAALTTGGLDVIATEFDATLPGVAQPAASVPVTQSVWDTVQKAANVAQRRVWCDESRTWRSEWVFASPADAVNLPRVKQGREVLDVDAGWADSLIVNTTATISTTVDTPTGPSAFTGPYTLTTQYPAGPLGDHVTVQNDRLEGTYPAGQIPTPTTDEMAARLARLQETGRVLEVTAPLDLTVRPGMQLTTGAPSLPQLVGVVTAVTFAVPEDTVTITVGTTTESEA